MNDAQRRVLYRALFLTAAGCLVLLFLLLEGWLRGGQEGAFLGFLLGGFAAAAAGFYVRAGGKKDDGG